MKKIWQSIDKQDTRNIVVMVVVLGIFLVLFLLFFKRVPPENKDLVNTLVDKIITLGFSAIFGYLFMASKATKSDQ